MNTYQPNPRKSFLYIILLLSLGLHYVAQAQINLGVTNTVSTTIQGPISVASGTTQSYRLSTTASVSTVTWSVTNGSIISKTNTSAQIQWHTASTGKVTVLIRSGGFNFYTAKIDVSISTSNIINWYRDSDGDGYGDFDAALVQNTARDFPGHSRNKLDQCPEAFSSSNNGCPESTDSTKTGNKNYISTRVFDADGVLAVAGRSYYNSLGKATQSLSYDFVTGDIWASETLYDQLGRPGLQSLSAPIRPFSQFNINSDELYYIDNFIRKPNGKTYSISDFDTHPESPSTVGSQKGSLGWYYSNNNTTEPYQDVSAYPFSRSIYSKLNPGQVKKVIGGNKAGGNWIQQYSFTMPAPGQGDGVSKTVNRDPHGVDTVVFTDAEGNTIAAARSGNEDDRSQAQTTVYSEISAQGYVDVHLPKGCVGLSIENAQGNTFKVYDLITENEITTSLSSLTNGFYRIAVSNVDTFHYKAHSPIKISHTNNYYDFSRNSYDANGRLLKTTQPLSASLVSRFKYNSLGELIESSSPDEGKAQFIYRKDGQIRFSQNSKQASDDEFSYTNYDHFGRPVESGVYESSASDSYIKKPLNIIDIVGIQKQGDQFVKVPVQGWNSGLATSKFITGDGYIEWRFPEGDEHAAVGLSSTNANYNYTTIDYAIYVIEGKIRIYESGAIRKPNPILEIYNFGTYTPSDVFKIERIQNTIHYKKNNHSMYTSSLSSSGPLLGDIALHSEKASLADFSIGGSVSTPSTVFKDLRNVNATPSGSLIKTKGSKTWNAGASSVQSISADGAVEFKITKNNIHMMAGLSSKVNVDHPSYVFIDYAMYLHANGRLYIYELGANKGQYGTYSASDVFKVRRRGHTIEYLKNDLVVYSSTRVSQNEDLVAKFSITTVGTGVNNMSLTGADYNFNDYYNTTSSGQSVKKTSRYHWDSGFHSQEAIKGDGFVTFRAPSEALHAMVGLSEYGGLSSGLQTTLGTNPVSYTSIDYALYLQRQRRVYIYESGVYKGIVSRSYKSGDVFKVERVNNTVKYYQNETLIYTSKTPTFRPLRVDNSFYDPGSTIEHLELYDIASPFSLVTSDSELEASQCKEQQFTIYDLPDAGLPAVLSQAGIPASAYKQSFVAGNVSKTFTQRPITTTSWYGYDGYGRVKWLVQNIAGLGVKTIDYQYDFARGYVNKVIYQKHSTTDRFYHKYQYDSKDQLTKVSTSVDDTNYTTQAEYSYYENGALKRTDLAEGLQGIDYVYNLNGQLKSINHPSLSAKLDPGGDANDLFGMTIDYHKDDYKRQLDNVETTSFGAQQYNGNIKSIRWNNGHQPAPNGLEHTYQYAYNKNNWLTGANFGTYSTPAASHSQNTTTNSLNTNQADTGFEALNGDFDVSNITYDANGNIQSLTRNKHTENGSNAMDDFSYHYRTDKPNQLDYVEDAITANTNAEDLKSQSTSNYEYNSIGQLIENKSEEVEYRYYTNGLVSEIHKKGVPLLKFFYNDRGHRVRKEIYNSTGALMRTDYYVRDASGSAMAIYENAEVKEHNIYGSGMLGVYKPGDGSSLYQLTDHLGNVRAVVGRASNGTPMGIVAATDYYPGGMAMPGRNIVGDYRYNYQGQELDEETGKVAFELRLYDPRINRWLTTDPKNEFHSPYLAMGNNWMNKIDPDGGSTAPPSTHLDEDGNVIAVYDDGDLGVYVHSNEELAAMGGLFGELGGFDSETMSLSTYGTTRIGETQFWDEFVSPETGLAVGRIDIGGSWNDLLAALHTKALDMDLREIAANSTRNQIFDVKANKKYAPYGGFTGKLLNGKYASARSAGNYLAGYNGRTGTYFGQSISWETYIKLAGAVHQGKWNKTNAFKIVTFGKSFGEAPWYGEIEYAGRQIQQGWKHTRFKK